MSYETIFNIKYDGNHERIHLDLGTEDRSLAFKTAQDLAKDKCAEYGNSYGTSNVTISIIRNKKTGEEINLENATNVFFFRLHDNHQAFITGNNSKLLEKEIRGYEELPQTD